MCGCEVGSDPDAVDGVHGHLCGYLKQASVIFRAQRSGSERVGAGRWAGARRDQVSMLCSKYSSDESLSRRCALEITAPAGIISSLILPPSHWAGIRPRGVTRDDWVRDWGTAPRLVHLSSHCLSSRLALIGGGTLHA